MKEKKQRFGIKEPGKEIKKILFVEPKEDVAHFGVRGATDHFTWIDEGDAISVHKTDQITGKHTPLGRIQKNKSEEEVDNILLDVIKVTSLDEKNRDRVVLCMTDKFLALTDVSENIAKKKIESENEIIEFYDADELNKYNEEKLKKITGIEDLLVFGTVEDIINDKYVYGLTENSTIIFKFNDELFELDFTDFFKAMFIYDENNPLSKFLATLGMFDIVKDSLEYFE